MKTIHIISKKAPLPIYAWFMLLFSMLSIFLMTSCANSINPTDTKTSETPTITSTEPLEPTATRQPPPPLGSSENPLIMSYILPIDSLFDPTILQTLVEQISLDTGYQIQVQIYRSPREAFEKLRSQEIHLVWMQPLTYLAAYERGLVEPMIVSNHYGLYQYGTMVLANQDSNFVSYFNEEENISTAPADIALRQLEGKRPCYVNESSLSGKIIPEGYLALNGIQPLNAVITQSYPATIRSLYIKGVCDFGATFAYTGDPRTSSQVLNDLPNALTQIDIIWRSDPVIPSLSLSSSSQVPDLIVETITQDFLAKVQTEEGKQQLTNALQYDVQDLLPIDHDFFGPFSLYVYASKVVPFQHLGY